MKKKKTRKVKKAAVYANSITPVVGMGATYSIGSDRYAQTITAVNKTGKTIMVVGANSIYTKHTNLKPNEGQTLIGYDESFTPNTGTVYTLRKNGYFHAKGSKAKYGYLTIGQRNTYMDPHF
jgi:hypothetical protein